MLTRALKEAMTEPRHRNHGKVGTMKLIIDISTDNATFGETEGDRTREVCRILQTLIVTLGKMGSPDDFHGILYNGGVKLLIDSKGHVVGKAKAFDDVDVK